MFQCVSLVGSGDTGIMLISLMGGDGATPEIAPLHCTACTVHGGRHYSIIINFMVNGVSNAYLVAPYIKILLWIILLR